jgi:hypothetical protein
MLLDASLHFQNDEVNQCDFKPGSVERSTDLEQGGV